MKDRNVVVPAIGLRNNLNNVRFESYLTEKIMKLLTSKGRWQYVVQYIEPKVMEKLEVELEKLIKSILK